MAFVYILQSETGRYYVGSTTDMAERLRHHAGGYTPSTRALGKMRLVLQQEYGTLSEARKVEGRIKRLKRKDYIAKIVKDGHIKMSG